MRTPAPLRILFSCALIAFSCISHAAPIEVNDGQHAVKLADAPKRVVVLEFSFLDSLAAVGVTPGAADDGDALQTKQDLERLQTKQVEACIGLVVSLGGGWVRSSS